MEAWVERQPPPSSGIIQSALSEQDDSWCPRLVFERPVAGLDWTVDPLFEEVARHHAAWIGHQEVERVEEVSCPYVVRDDPRALPPYSAWLLMGDEASFLTQQELDMHAEAAAAGIFACDWTVAAQTQPGDLVLLYFLAPHKAVHFIARAATRAHFRRDLQVAANKAVNQAQWWARLTAPIRIHPLPLGRLREAVGGPLPLRGRSGHYLRPESIAALNVRAVDPQQQADLELVFKVPVGLPDLPDPAAMSLSTWRDIAAGALPLEAHVSSHVVEPLLRHLGDTQLTWVREYRVGNRYADFVVLDAGRPVHVIEVKKALQHGPHADLTTSPDLHQLRWYAQRLGVPGTLVDSHRILPLPDDDKAPLQVLERRCLTTDELERLSIHMRPCYPVS